MCDLFDDNISIFKYFKAILEDNNLKADIKKRNLANTDTNIEEILDKESMKYFFGLDLERTSMFFVNQVILCEGSSEKVFFEYLINTKWHKIKQKKYIHIRLCGKV